MELQFPTVAQPTFRSLSSTSSGVESEVEEEEVDQLDSDTDEEPQPISVGPVSSPSKTRPKIPVERVPGKSTIPLGRIESLLEAEGTSGGFIVSFLPYPSTGEENYMSKEAVFILAVATEEFIKRLMEAGHRTAQTSRRSMVTYKDVAFATKQYQEFMFLRDTIPQPISLAEALQRRAAKEKEILEEPPALSINLIPAPSLAPSLAPSETPSATPDFIPPSASARSRGKAKQAPQSHTNGDANGGPPPEPKPTRQRKSRKRQPDGDAPSASASAHEPPPPTHSHRTRRRSSRASQKDADLLMDVTDTPLSLANGYSASTNGHSISQHSLPSEGWGSVMGPPPPSRSTEYEDDSYGTPEYGPDDVPVSWPPAPPTHFTGPASGYLEDHRMLFSGRNGMASNPGRTIYNAQRPPNR
ncbi:hypothetical protein BXZ70DRAFT_594630 [Cristinia sonorae]|uniref:Transcription factor CBF/NF-Y/archaeal histone domain-containing protein n=1 Tax=Cristinia sonorae TaxID=1940300 RepID=A0A8K0UVM1_9AGAR|nr:hypothetical protein BXZ70DRAFT_594630 [Cristinia sonorae]